MEPADGRHVFTFRLTQSQFCLDDCVETYFGLHYPAHVETRAFEQLHPLALIPLYATARPHIDVLHGRDGGAVDLRQNIGLYQQPRIPGLETRLKLFEDLNALAVRPVVQNPPEMVILGPLDRLGHEEVVRHGLGGRLRGVRPRDDGGQVLEDLAAGELWMLLNEPVQVLTVAAADVDHEDVALPLVYRGLEATEAFRVGELRKPFLRREIL